VIPAAGHVANADQPELFNRHVLAFLDRLGPPAPPIPRRRQAGA
jgi:hypothetical protein